MIILKNKGMYNEYPLYSLQLLNERLNQNIKNNLCAPTPTHFTHTSNTTSPGSKRKKSSVCRKRVSLCALCLVMVKMFLQ